MQLIVNADDIILASHDDGQDVLDRYPANCRSLFVPEGTRVFDAQGLPRALADIQAEVMPQERTVRVIDGGKISAATRAALESASTVADLRAALLTILVGSGG